MKSLHDLLLFLINPRTQYDQLKSSRGVIHGVEDSESPSGARRQLRLRDVLINFPLIAGGIIVLGLFLLVLFGPLWAPINPYIAGRHIVPHYDADKEVWINPPLEPSNEYPLGTDEWGNDILSMLLYGARNTLIAGAFITMVRMVVGLILGAVAGWNNGKTSDQLIMGAIGVIMAIPMLISSMILIYALDIRKGLPVFIIALSVIGWTQIAQYIRSEFIVLREKPYIEGARAVGARNFAIAVRHVLPNILPQLLIITFIELGAVLLLMGELAFIGVYIGGGSRIALGDELIGIEVITQSDVPEWGAMLAEGYRWLRAKPFIVFPPAIAFFVAVVGFNAFGEGFRRLIDTHHINTNFLLRKRMILVLITLSFSTMFIINNTGPAPWFARVAQAFNGLSAYEYTETLSSMDGRGIGQDGSERAASYLAGEFEKLGLRPGWSHSSYVYPLEISIARPRVQPELSMINTEGNPILHFNHQSDFGYMTEGHAGNGSVEGSLIFVGFDREKKSYSWEDFQGLDLREKIVLIIQGNAPRDFVDEALIRGALGVIWIAGEDPDDIQSQVQLLDKVGDSLRRPNLPVFRVRTSVAEELLNQANSSISILAEPGGDISDSGPGWFTRQIPVMLRMSLELEDPRSIQVPCVLGYLPGSDYELANQMVVIIANYDGLGTDPDGTIFPGANHNASGIGVMLELARLWQEQNLDPRRMVLFIAWGGGQLDNPRLQEFLSDNESFNYLPATSSNTPRLPYTIFQLDNVGRGGEDLLVHPSSDQRLVELIKETANEVDVSVISENYVPRAKVDLLTVNRATSIYLTWVGGDISPESDSFDHINADKLKAVGETISLALTKIVRESRY
jgi:peptide/nickel transport system permease protein